MYINLIITIICVADNDICQRESQVAVSPPYKVPCWNIFPMQLNMVKLTHNKSIILKFNLEILYTGFFSVILFQMKTIN